VRIENDHARLTGSLVDAVTQTTLRDFDLDRPLADLAELEELLVRGIASSLASPVQLASTRDGGP
jgi:TolB-like protein